LGHLLDAGLEILPAQNQIGPYEYVVRVRALSVRRGPAPSCPKDGLAEYLRGATIVLPHHFGTPS
jgi:hypothetical protein